MSDKYVYVRDLRDQVDTPKDRPSSQTLINDGKTRVILFGFAAGQELSAHKAPVPVTLTFLKGEAVLTLGADEQEAAEGTLVYMPPHLEHGVKARTDVVMLLTMIKDHVVQSASE